MTLNDIQKYIFENYGQQPTKMPYDWQQNRIWYRIERGTLSIDIGKRAVTKEEYIFIWVDKGSSGEGLSCNSLEDLDHCLRTRLDKKISQLSLF